MSWNWMIRQQFAVLPPTRWERIKMWWRKATHRPWYKGH